MVEIIYNIFENDFNKNLTHSYNLSILLGSDRLSYLISDQQNQVVALRAYQLSEGQAQNPLKQLLIEDSIVREKFRTVKIAVFSPRFSLIPLSLFDEKQHAVYLEQTVSLQRDDRVFFDTIKHLNAANIYAFEEPYVEGILDHFPGAQVYHVSTGLINNFITNFDSSASKNIFLNVYDHYVVITVVENSKLLFHNIF